MVHEATTDKFVYQRTQCQNNIGHIQFLTNYFHFEQFIQPAFECNYVLWRMLQFQCRCKFRRWIGLQYQNAYKRSAAVYWRAHEVIFLSTVSHHKKILENVLKTMTLDFNTFSSITVIVPSYLICDCVTICSE